MQGDEQSCFQSHRSHLWDYEGDVNQRAAMAGPPSRLSSAACFLRGPGATPLSAGMKGPSTLH